MRPMALKTRQDAAPLNLGLVVASVSREGGGVFECLRGLAPHLHQPPQTRVRVFGIEDPHTAADLPLWKGLPVTVSPVRGPSAFGYAPALGRALRDSALDVVHVHGLWKYVTPATHRWATALGRPYMVSPHGHLDAWALAQSRWVKRAARILYEDRTLRGAACIHALCQPEADAIRAAGLRNPVCIIPNGVDLPAGEPPAPPAWRSTLPTGTRILLYLGRIAPQKGLTNLLHAWSLAAQRAAGAAGSWHLAIAGWDKGGYEETLKDLARTLMIGDRVSFIGPQYGAEKKATLAAADAFILPSLSEGLPMAVLEAWSYGLPGIITPQCNLPIGFQRNAALRAEPRVDSVAQSLRTLFDMPEPRRREIGQNGLALVRERFTWPVVAAQLEQVYRWIAGSQPPPETVQM